jgi:hypothetical protein
MSPSLLEFSFSVIRKGAAQRRSAWSPDHSSAQPGILAPLTSIVERHPWPTRRGRSGASRGQLILKRLDSPTLDNLRRYLRDFEPHVLHFVGHGDFDTGLKEGVVLFQDADGRGQLVSAEMLATLVGNCPSLQLVTLNSCDGARTEATDVFAGTAQRLVQQGVPAVVAMQFPVTDKAAIVFANEFYGALSGGYSVDAALGEARVAMQGAGSELEWGTPVLYMRSPEGRLFDVEPLSDADQLQHELGSLRNAAESAEAIDNWDEAVTRWAAAVSLAPADPDARLRLAHARNQQAMRAVFVQGQQHDQAGRWRQAFDAYYRVVELGGDYNSVFRHLARVRRRLAEADDPARPAAQDNGLMPTSGTEPDLLALDRPFCGHHARARECRTHRRVQSRWPTGRHCQ